MKQGWYAIANKAQSLGWKNIDVQRLEDSLSKNVLTSYEHLFESEFEDLDDSIHYTVFFDNNKKLFDLKLTNTKTGEILPEQKKALFNTETFKKTAKRAYEILTRSLETYQQIIRTHIEAGELLKVDETKLEAIENFLQDQQLLKNFRLAKYAK